MRNINNKSIFSKNLILLRKERGLSQKELAKLSGITQRMIVYYECEGGNPPIEKIKNIADALNVNIDDLLLDNKKNTKKVIRNELTEINTKTLKKIKQILSLSPESRHVVYSLVDSLLIKEGKNK